MKSVVLLSGGIDSAVCLALARGSDRLALGFDYGQPHQIELQHAQKVADAEGVSLLVQHLPFMGKINDVVFAGRNAVLASLAASLAASRGYEAVVMGCNYSDWQRFPDCRPAFINPLREALKYGYGISLSTPLLRMSKHQIVDKAKELGVDLSLTWSCYNPQQGRACGKCLACETRVAAGAPL